MPGYKDFSEIIPKLSSETVSRANSNMVDLGLIKAANSDWNSRLKFLINTSKGFEKKIYQSILDGGSDGVERMAASILKEYQTQRLKYLKRKEDAI